MNRKPFKLETNPLWKEANWLAEYIYGKLADLPDEEKWESQRKLRTAANDLIFYVAQAVGNGAPAALEYDWGNARKHAATLLTMYRFVGRQKFIDLDPEIMVRLSALIEDIDTETGRAYAQTKSRDEEELRPWMEKYRIWKQITEDKK